MFCFSSVFGFETYWGYMTLNTKLADDRTNSGTNNIIQMYYRIKFVNGADIGDQVGSYNKIQPRSFQFNFFNIYIWGNL